MLHHTSFTFREKLKLRERNATKYIIIHHSRVSGKHDVRDVHQWHLDRKDKDGNPWAGIGYHYFISKKGEIYEGRPLDTVGSHAVPYNSCSVGVCFEGNFNTQKMTKRQLNASVVLLSLLSLAYGNAQLRKHDTLVPGRCCPGKDFPYDELIRKVRVCKQGLVALYGDAYDYKGMIAKLPVVKD